MYRTEESGRTAPAGVHTVVADYADKATLRPALAGVEVVFLVCSPIPQLVEYEKNVIDVAVESGVRHIVLNSALGAGDYPISFPSWHRQVEAHLKSTGLSSTIFRPNAFMQNIVTYNSASIRAQGAFFDAMGEARTSFLDVRDIAAVTAKALLDPAAYAGQTYELNGPEAVTNTELAERISRAAGRDVRYVPIAEEDQRQAMLGMGMPAWQVEAILGLQRYYTGGQGGEVTDVLASLLGREPIGLDAFLTETKNSFLGEGK
jgi:uncharacterized protein YbjT (DUF2867 family)